ncbi:hypothetical protein IW262DRAFT_909432 [Armillaria fumosa]|nr:hypothetical protein IW262DRAFT_909432 [Armillaria fumosa]
MIDALKKKISARDVLTIVKTSSRITTLGSSIARSRGYDALGDRIVRCLEAEMQKRRDVVYTVSAHETYDIKTRTPGFLALFTGDTGDIKPELQIPRNDARRARLISFRTYMYFFDQNVCTNENTI